MVEQNYRFRCLITRSGRFAYHDAILRIPLIFQIQTPRKPAQIIGHTPLMMRRARNPVEFTEYTQHSV